MVNNAGYFYTTELLLMNLKRLFVACTLLTGIHATAQTIHTAKLDSLFNILSAKDRAMGSVAIAQNGKLLYSRAIGFSDNEKNITRSTPDTRYRIGSITKMFTACMAFQLIEDKKLGMDTKLSVYFPSIPNAGKITIGQMLGHRSGIANITDDKRYPAFSRDAKTQKQIVGFISAIQPAFPPDSTAEYSNSNYILLGYIVEAIYKKPYQQVLKEKITQKAGMKNTFYGAAPDHKETMSYRYDEQWKVVPPTHASIPGGAGAIMSTPTDLTLFLDALFAGKIISNTSLEQMKTIRDGYGMGMFTFPFNQETFYGHNGGIDGFSSIAGRNLKDGLTISYCANGNRYPMNDILIGVLSICYNVPYTIPDFNTIAVTAADLDQYTGTYASSQLPIKITVKKENDQLQAQATGQSAFPLTPTTKDKFSFDSAGIILEFNPATHEMTLKQGGGSFTFKRENP